MKAFLKKLHNKKISEATFADLPDEIILKIMSYLVQPIDAANSNNNNNNNNNNKVSLDGYFELYRLSKVSKRLNRIACDERLDPNYTKEVKELFGLKKAIANAKSAFFKPNPDTFQTRKDIYYNGPNFETRFMKFMCMIPYLTYLGKKSALLNELNQYLNYNAYNIVNELPLLQIAIFHYEEIISNFYKSNNSQKKKYRKEMNILLDVIKVLLKNGANLDAPFYRRPGIALTIDILIGITSLEMAKKIRNIYQDNELVNFLEKYSNKYNKKLNPLNH